MRLWLLSRLHCIDYDEYDAKIIRAETAAQARKIANENCASEGKIWTDVSEVKCVGLSHTGPAEEILGAFRAG